jgi:hypothetical protein
MAKSPGFDPVNPMLLMLIDAVPLLVRVADLGPPALPTVTVPQVMDAGETVVVPATATPVPERATVTGVEL